MKKLKKNNKGFSLVELVISVVILAVIALPLLQIFTVSAGITRKARNRGQETAAAQNIQETIEARGVNSICSRELSGGRYVMKDTVALSMLGEDEIPQENTYVHKREDNPGDANSYDYVTVKGVSVGSQVYDAKVTFDRDGRLIGENNSIGYKINDKPISQYTDMSGTFSQPYSSSQNPDEISKRDFGLLYPSASAGSRRRVINVNAYSEPDTEQPGYKVYVDITFSYIYTVNGAETPINSTYNIFPSGKHIDSYDDEISCFLMYYAFYENTDRTEVINIYVDNENATSDLKFKLFLIKQVPMVIGNNGILVNALDDTAGGKGQEEINKDRYYKLEINEFHNERFTFVANSHDVLDESMMNVFTNANKQLKNINDGTDLDIANFSYRLKKPHSSGYFYFTKETIARNQLVKTEPEDRFFDVIIEIYNSGAINADGSLADANAKPIYTLNANKLK